MQLASSLCSKCHHFRTTSTYRSKCPNFFFFFLSLKVKPLIRLIMMISVLFNFTSHHLMLHVHQPAQSWSGSGVLMTIIIIELMSSSASNMLPIYWKYFMFSSNTLLRVSSSSFLAMAVANVPYPLYSVCRHSNRLPYMNFPLNHSIIYESISSSP